MLQRIQALPRGQRLVIFVLLFGGAIFGLLALTAFLILLSFNTGERSQGIGLIEGVTVREFATLPDDDAYPASIAVAPDGTVYTGSYATGAIWAIDPSGTIREIPNTRERVGAVSGLAVAPDGSLLVVDLIDPNPLTLGGDVKRVLPADGTISLFAEGLEEDGFLLPDDITLDSAGNVYITDRGREQVWRFGPDGGNGGVWWTPPLQNTESRQALTGLAYDPLNSAIIITESNNDSIYSVTLDGANTQLVYAHGNREFPPGFDGVTVAPDGRLYVTAVAQNGIVTLNSGQIEYVAGAFRGASDVEYHNGQLYVANFDSFSLVVGAISPRLPFGIDVVTLP